MIKLKLVILAFISSFTVWSSLACGQTVDLSGHVVTNDDKPVGGSKVVLFNRLSADDRRETLCNADGHFEFKGLGKKEATRLRLHAFSPDEELCAIGPILAISDGSSSLDVKIVLQASWRFHLDVFDDKGQPVEAAKALVMLPGFECFRAETNASGRAFFVLPRREPIQKVSAWKDGVGFSYHAYTPADPGRAPGKPPIRYPDPAADKLTLKPASDVAIQVVDEQGNAIAGANVSPTLLTMKGEPSHMDVYLGMDGVRTDTAGVATFRWIPSNINLLTFQASAKGFVSTQSLCKLAEQTPKLILQRPIKLKGRVLDTEGKPQPGIKVVANGNTYDQSHIDRGVTEADGKFELSVKPNGTYVVFVDDEKLVAPARGGIVAQRGKDIDGIDLQLVPPVIVRGRLLDVFSKLPAKDEVIRLEQVARELTDEELGRLEQPTGRPKLLGSPRSSRNTKTDQEGRYEFFVAPGAYEFCHQGYSKDLTVAPPGPIDFDIPTRIKIVNKFSGVVIDKSSGRSLANVAVYDLGIAKPPTFNVITDQRGIFTVERPLEDAYLAATTEDYAMAGMAHVGPGQSEVRIECERTGTATGQLKAADGQPLAGITVCYQTQIQAKDSPQGGYLVKRCETNAQGEFTLTALFAGAEYSIYIDKDPAKQPEILERFEAVAGETVELGIIRH